jgi:hypothetical protein
MPLEADIRAGVQHVCFVLPLADILASPLCAKDAEAATMFAWHSAKAICHRQPISEMGRQRLQDVCRKIAPESALARKLTCPNLVAHASRLCTRAEEQA